MLSRAKIGPYAQYGEHSATFQLVAHGLGLTGGRSGVAGEAVNDMYLAMEVITAD